MLLQMERAGLLRPNLLNDSKELMVSGRQNLNNADVENQIRTGRISTLGQLESLLAMERPRAVRGTQEPTTSSAGHQSAC